MKQWIVKIYFMNRKAGSDSRVINAEKKQKLKKVMNIIPSHRNIILICLLPKQLIFSEKISYMFKNFLFFSLSLQRHYFTPSSNLLVLRKIIFFTSFVRKLFQFHVTHIRTSFERTMYCSRSLF